MSASGPHRQRSLRDRINQGISNITWHGKPANKPQSGFTSFLQSSDDPEKPYILSSSDNRSLSLDTHGYVNPLDWEVPSYKSTELKLGVSPLLPSKTGPSAECIYTVTHTVDGHTKEKSQTAKMVTRSITQPEGTVPCTVTASDTLAGIAARFYTTPSELAKINRLSSRLIFPGQVLYVPKRDANVNEEAPLCATPPSTPIDKQMSSPVSPSKQGTSSSSTEMHQTSKPGHVERVITPESKLAPKNEATSPTLSQEEEERRLDEECHKKFLKVNVRHITDGQGVVPGVLLVTPNALMFDPNVSDALVIERGSEKYSVTCPMNMVANAAMYRDIAHMKLKNVPTCSDQDGKGREVYHTVTCPKFNEQSVDAENKPQESTEDKSDELSCSCRQTSPKPDKTEEPEPEQESPPPSETQDASQEITSQDLMDLSCNMECEDKANAEPLPASPKSNGAGSRSSWYSQLPDISQLPSHIDFSMFKSSRSENSESFSSDSNEQAVSESHKQRLLKRLSQPVSWIESFASGSVDSAHEITATASSTLSKILPHPFSSSSEKDDTPPTSAPPHPVRHFSSSPQSFVDFSSGLFAHDYSPKVRDMSELSSFSASDKPKLLESTESTDSAQSANQVFLPNDEPHKSDSSITKKVQIQNMVEGNPSLFASIEKLIPKPASSYDDPPLYLCLLMGHPPKSAGANVQDLSPTFHKHALMSYGQKGIRPEYWFSIPRDKVDELYGFFQMWAPGVYGDPSTIDFEAKGYKLIETDEEFSDDEHDGNGSKVSMSKSRPQSSPRSVGSLLKMVEEHFLAQSPFERESGSQVLSLGEIPSLMSLDSELPLPDMIGTSAFITDEHRRLLNSHLPARAEGYPWQLLYSNTEHGFSLKTLYREMGKYECPAVIFVKDVENAVFGAMVPCSLKISDHFYGNGESFLFTFHPEFKCFHWTGENNYFIKGAADSLAFGAGEGVFGLWLDEDLYKGRTHSCLTYNNDLLSSSEDFMINAIEIWGFMYP